MRKIIAPLFILLLAFVIFWSNRPSGLHEIHVETQKARYNFLVELATTPDEQTKGLMGREFLPEGEGMLFVYPQEQPVSFWMKNMEIPLDMIFIGADRKVKHIEKNVPPCNTPSCLNYRPPAPVQYVLEVQSGFTEKSALQIGDTVDLAKVIDQ